MLDDGALQVLGRNVSKFDNIKIHSIAAGSEYTVFTTGTIIFKLTV
jgi:hypothetical protein